MQLTTEKVLLALGLEDQVFNVKTACRCAGECGCVSYPSMDETVRSSDYNEEEVNNILQETVDIISNYGIEDEQLQSLSETAELLNVLNNRIIDADEGGLSKEAAIDIRNSIDTKLSVFNYKSNPIPTPQAFDLDPVEATSISLESFGEIVSISVDALIAACKKLYQLLKDLVGRLMLVVGKLRSKVRDNTDAIHRATKDYDIVPNVPENYVVIEKEVRSFYRFDLSGFSTDLVMDTANLGQFLKGAFLPYLEEEIETANTLIDIYRPLTTVTIDYERDEIAKYNAQIEDIYQAQKDNINRLFAPYEGEFVGGLQVKLDNNNPRVEITKSGVRTNKASFLALSSSRLTTLNNLAGEILDIANNQLHKQYKAYEAASQKGVDTITTMGEVYRKDKKNSFSGSKAKRLDGMLAKHFSHFRQTSGNISNTINIFTRLSYTIVNDFVPKNIAILSNLKSQ